MWLFKKKSKHVALDTLSEYLDGRLSDADVRRVEDHLRACDSCSVELESLRDTVGLLRQTPVVARRRDFTFAQAPEPVGQPEEPGASGGFPGFRVPVWAYGAAASVAVVAFAVTLSIDVTRGPGGGGNDVASLQERPDSSRENFEAAGEAPTGAPMPDQATPAPLLEEPAVTAIPAPPTSTPEPMSTMLEDPDPQPTPMPQSDISTEKVQEDSSEGEAEAMSQAVERATVSGQKATIAPDAAAGPERSDMVAAESQATSLPVATPMPMPAPTLVPVATTYLSPIATVSPTTTLVPTFTPAPTATPPPKPTATLSPTPTPRPKSPPVVPLAPEGGMERGTWVDSVDATGEDIARAWEPLETDRGISVWWIVEGVLAAIALGLVVVLALKLHARHRRAS